MTAKWRFKDEWIVKALTGAPGILPAFIDDLRSENKSCLADAVVDAGKITLEELGKRVESAFSIKYFPLTPAKVDNFAVNLILEKNCRKYELLPVAVTDTEVQVVMANPLDMDAAGYVEALTARRVIPLYSPPCVVESCLEKVFRGDEIVFDLLNKVEAPEEILVIGDGDIEADNAKKEEPISAPVILLVNSIISQAYHKRSSDIHIEHEEKASHVRIRIDGVLKNIMALPKHIAAGPLVSRIKIMANLDVSNHMRPQDGRTKILLGGSEVGLRVSTLPTSYGEKVVIRILDQRAAEVPFEKLGFAPEVSAVIENCLAAAQGLILVTGPTGSGKTTTLYSVLNKIRSEGSNIVTVEDPIEYKLAGINQVQVNEKQGLTFASVLRSVLRQDPDIIMVGEIRDRDTADIAFQAAMTGHMVFSTLHTNDAVAAIPRLIDMGVDRFKISPGLLAITAQRLVRKICPHCVVKMPAAESDRGLMDAMTSYGFEPALYKGRGCMKCEGSGYAGRTAIVEILQVNGRVRDIINSGAGAAEITQAALEDKVLRTMTHDALWQLSRGYTDLAEAAPYMYLDTKSAEGQTTPPAASPVRSGRVGAETRSSESPSSGKLRIMLAEDDSIVRMLLRKFVEGAGYEALEAEDGEEALTIIAHKAPDLLISDIHMPRLNGFDLVKGVRETLGLSDLPVIMLTTETSDKSQELAFKLGADDYIIKPFRANIFLARINAALRRSGKIK